MIAGLFRFVVQLLTFAVVVVILTAVYVVYDGVTDTGDRADCAVVLGAAVRSDGAPSAVLRERLDTAVKLYKASKVPVIIVSGADPVKGEGYSEAGSMARYLAAHEVSPGAIVQDRQGVNTDATARDVAAIMAAHQFNTVMIVTSYYHITRTKMAFKREGVSGYFQTHAGSVRKEDFFNTAREVVDIYYHLFKYYLGPAAQKAGMQLQTEAQKLSSQLQSETKKVEAEGKKAAN